MTPRVRWIFRWLGGLWFAVLTIVGGVVPAGEAPKSHLSGEKWSSLISSRAVAGPAAPSKTERADDAENPHVWKPQTKSVAVFKNGLGFFMREGDVKLREGWCVAREVPPALFGTLAIYSRSEKEAVDIVGSGPGEVVEFDGRDAPKDAAAKRGPQALVDT